jgi:asparaginyl-tRNA synthetase
MGKYFEFLGEKLKNYLDLFESIVVRPFEFKTPFKVYTTHELESKYGKDWEKEASIANEQPFWALCHKREFYDKEDESNPGHYLNYDLVYPQGFGEALSGAEREYDYKRIIERMGKDRLNMRIYEPTSLRQRRDLYPQLEQASGSRDS